VQITGINATFTLTEIATNKIVVTGQTFSRVSYDAPG
jgi:LPS-assembly lipoprotein